MARKTKKQQNSIEEIIKGILAITAVGSYYFTKSIHITIAAICLVIILLFVWAFYSGKKEKERLRKSGINDIDKMNGIQFEVYLKELFRSQGYQVEGTKASGDFGADLILKKDNKKIVVQAKRYSKNVGIKAVQEAISGKSYYNATEAWVVTNSNYTKAAIELAAKSNVLLINRTSLIDNIISLKTV